MLTLCSYEAIIVLMLVLNTSLVSFFQEQHKAFEKQTIVQTVHNFIGRQQKAQAKVVNL